jgi:hypothetical protein
MEKAARPKKDRTPLSILHLVKQVQYKAYVRLESVFQPLGITAVQFRILTTLSSKRAPPRPSWHGSTTSSRRR